MYVLTVSFYYFYLIILIIFQGCPRTLRTGLVRCTFLIMLYLCIKLIKFHPVDLLKLYSGQGSLQRTAKPLGDFYIYILNFYKWENYFNCFKLIKNISLVTSISEMIFWGITCSISKLHILNFNSIYLHKSLTLLLGIALSFWNLWASNL